MAVPTRQAHETSTWHCLAGVLASIFCFEWSVSNTGYSRNEKHNYQIDSRKKMCPASFVLSGRFPTLRTLEMTQLPNRQQKKKCAQRLLFWVVGFKQWVLWQREIVTKSTAATTTTTTTKRYVFYTWTGTVAAPPPSSHLLLHPWLGHLGIHHVCSYSQFPPRIPAVIPNRPYHGRRNSHSSLLKT